MTTRSISIRIAGSVLSLIAFAVIFGVVAYIFNATPVGAQETTEVVDTGSSAGEPGEQASTQTSSTEEVDSAGTQGESGEASPENSQIETGDASSTSDSDTIANTNEATMDTASSTVAADNEADTETQATSTAQTGGNNASGGGGGAAVATGDAIATGNVINVVNANIVNSSGLIAFLNFFFGGSIDLSSFFDPNAQGDCSLMFCGDSLNVGAENDGTLDSSLFVSASSGGNSALGVGDASITTGNAYASGNLVNVVNTNIVNSHYILLALNNFGDLLGDITLPNAEFFKKLLEGSSSTPAVSSVDISNNADVTSSSTAAALTGDNAATGDGSSVASGNAFAGGSTVNAINTTGIGGATVFILLNVFGSWNGGIQGLPPGLTWAPTPTGVAIMSSGSFSGLTPGGDSTVAVSADNEAKLHNNVGVYALTGANVASSASSSASIRTGNAYASANILNLVNSNVIGQNWIFAILNIYGAWDGSLAFGHPDLWIGATVETSNPTPPGSKATYHFTVANRGDADANGVTLRADFAQGLLTFDHTDKHTANDVTWNLGTIKKGEVKEFTYVGTTATLSRGERQSLPLTATVRALERDPNLSDNSDTVTLDLWDGVRFVGGAPVGLRTPDPDLAFSSRSSIGSAELPVNANYSISLTNNGGELYGGVLTDTLFDSTGGKVFSRTWDLGIVRQNDEINVTYTLAYGTSTKPGTYTSVATLTGRYGGTVPSLQQDIKPMRATTTVDLLPVGQVLGASVAPQKCAAYITSTLTPSGNNSTSQVRRLQFFLRDFANANIAISGTFDASTTDAVKNFQQAHADEILAPWGFEEPTGNVSLTTRNVINNMYCQGVATFSLDKSDMNTISLWKGDHGTAALTSTSVGSKLKATLKSVGKLFSTGQ